MLRAFGAFQVQHHGKGVCWAMLSLSLLWASVVGASEEFSEAGLCSYALLLGLLGLWVIKADSSTLLSEVRVQTRCPFFLCNRHTPYMAYMVGASSSIHMYACIYLPGQIIPSHFMLQLSCFGSRLLSCHKALSQQITGAQAFVVTA